MTILVYGLTGFSCGLGFGVVVAVLVAITSTVQELGEV